MIDLFIKTSGLVLFAAWYVFMVRSAYNQMMEHIDKAQSTRASASMDSEWGLACDVLGPPVGYSILLFAYVVLGIILMHNAIT